MFFKEYEIVAVNHLGYIIEAIYHEGDLVWPTEGNNLCCFGNGWWINEYGWLNGEGWKN